MVDNNHTGLTARFHRPSTFLIWLVLGLFLITAIALLGHHHARVWVLTIFVVLPFYVALMSFIGAFIGFNDRQPARTGRTFENGQPYFEQAPREFTPTTDDVVTVDGWERFLKTNNTRPAA